jgi:ribosomal protein L14E/L6E/L27E
METSQMEITVGMFVKSKAGHDKNQIYVVINCDDEYVYLSNGRLKTTEHPKKKKIKHIQLIGYGNPENNNLLKNEDIKRAIKNYLAERNKEV